MMESKKKIRKENNLKRREAFETLVSNDSELDSMVRAFSRINGLFQVIALVSMLTAFVGTLIPMGVCTSDGNYTTYWIYNYGFMGIFGLYFISLFLSFIFIIKKAGLWMAIVNIIGIVRVSFYPGELLFFSMGLSDGFLFMIIGSSCLLLCGICVSIIEFRFRKKLNGTCDEKFRISDVNFHALKAYTFSRNIKRIIYCSVFSILLLISIDSFFPIYKYDYVYASGNAFYIKAHNNNISGVVEIPDSFMNCSISVAKYGFDDCDSITEVIIPEHVTEIGVNAFYGCDNLTKVTIKSSGTIIGRNAFDACPLLDEILYK